MDLSEKSLSGIRVLCVDDCHDTVEYLRNFLVRKGADVTVSNSAEEAIATLINKRFDVMISDLSMPPGLDGYDLAHALRTMENNDPDRIATPTIALSGDAMRPSRKRRFADFQVYMPKPVDKERLVHVIERLVEADDEAVKLGSLGGWEAKEATGAALLATEVAAEAMSAAIDATNEAVRATEAASRGSVAAIEAETKASFAAANSVPDRLH